MSVTIAANGNKPSFLTNISIGTRVWLALLLPVIGLLFFSTQILLDKQRVSSDMGRLNSLSGLAPVVSQLVHEMQKERGASAIFIGSQGSVFASELRNQQSVTNTALGNLKKELSTFDAGIFGKGFSDKLITAQSVLVNLEPTRQSVSGLSIDVAKMASYYTPTIAKLLAVVEEMALLSNNAKVTNAITAYTTFLQGKERAGIERAMGGAGFGAGQFKPAIFMKFVKLISAQETYLRMFKKYATADLISYLEATLQGDVVNEVKRMREIAISGYSSGDLQGIEGPYWFSTITKKNKFTKTNRR